MRFQPLCSVLLHVSTQRKLLVVLRHMCLVCRVQHSLQPSHGPTERPRALLVELVVP